LIKELIQTDKEKMFIGTVENKKKSSIFQKLKRIIYGK